MGRREHYLIRKWEALLWFVFPSMLRVHPIQVWWLIKYSELRQGKQPQQNTKGWRKKATGTNTVHLQTNDPACTPVWHTVWNFRVTYHKSYLTADHLTSHFTILCNHKTYAQAGYTSVMLKGCNDEIMAAVLSDQTWEWLYHPHYNSSDLTPAPDIHKFSHIQLSYFALCKRKQHSYKR